MRIAAAVLAIGILILPSHRGWGEDKALPDVLKKLEQTLEEVIDACESSVVCILVSRSEEYHRSG